MHVQAVTENRKTAKSAQVDGDILITHDVLRAYYGTNAAVQTMCANRSYCGAVYAADGATLVVLR
jgi:hypothetical protein